MDHVKAVTKMVIPTFVLFAVVDLINQINVVFVGKTNNAQMIAGIGLAKSLFEMFPACFTIGCAGALETMVSQSYGKNNFKQCGDYLNKQYILITALYIPISLILFFSEDILIAFNQDAAAAKYAS